MRFILFFHKALQTLKDFDFIGILLLRLYLSQVFWFAGKGKITNFNQFSEWLDSLGFPFPDIFTWLVIATEAGGALFLLVGLFVRWVTIPMLVTMAVAIFMVHWDNGWARESNGIEMAVTYSIMLIILLLSGGGKFFSLDYWIARK